MKKNFKIKALILLVVLAMTSGCIKVETGMKISATKNVEAFYNIGMMDSLVSQTGADSSAFDSNAQKLKEQGYKVEDYKEDGYTGIKATRKLGNLDDLSYEGELRVVNLDKADANTKYFKVEKSFFKNTYTASFTTTVNNDVMSEIEEQQNQEQSNTGDEEVVLEETEVEAIVDEVNEDPKTDEAPVDSSSDDTPKDSELPKDDDGTNPPVDDNTDVVNEDDNLEQIKNMMKVKYQVELPLKALSSNATSTSSNGKVLEWNLMEWKEGATIEFKFEVLNLTNILIVGGGALLILAIIIIIIIVRSKSKKQQVAPTTKEEQPVVAISSEKESVLTPVAPAEGLHDFKPAGEAAEIKEVIPEVPATESVAPVSVDLPKIAEVPGVATPQEPSEAKTE